MKRIINFSGGKTSAYMTILEYKPGDIVLFCDTGREHEKTYKFIHDFEAHERIPVTKITFGSLKEGVWGERSDGSYGYVYEVDALTSFERLLLKRRHEHIPNMMQRTCTLELKVRTARRYLVSIGFKSYENLIGFRADEANRVFRNSEKLKRVVTKFPLYEKCITKEMITDYWKDKPYKLEIPGILGNCDLCFMKGKNAIISILLSYPELADKWIADEQKSGKSYGHTYLPGISMKTMKEIAESNLFKGYDLGEIKPAFDCACTT